MRGGLGDLDGGDGDQNFISDSKGARNSKGITVNRTLPHGLGAVYLSFLAPAPTVQGRCYSLILYFLLFTAVLPIRSQVQGG